jgi:hypothetical protein
MPVGNGGIIGVANDPTVTVASGVWGMSAVYLAVKAGTWPGLGKTVIQTFTASGTWTCPTGVTEVEYLVVAGGGGGGAISWRRFRCGWFPHRNGPKRNRWNGLHHYCRWRWNYWKH